MRNAKILLVCGCALVLAGCVTSPGVPLQTDERKALQKENRSLREALARAGRTGQSTPVVCADTDRDDDRKLREELELYRNIVSPPDRKSGLRVQGFDVRPAASTTSAPAYRYKLTLIQSIKHDRVIRGTAMVEAVGSINGKETSVSTYPSKIEVKYLQEFEGNFNLPASFKPQYVKITVVTDDAKKIDTRYEWPGGLSANLPGGPLLTEARK